MAKRLILSVLICLAVVVLWLLVRLLVVPELSAAAFPGTVGFEKTEIPGIYVEAVMSAEEKNTVFHEIMAAQKRTERFFGQLEARPVLLVCATGQCGRYFGSGPHPNGRRISIKYRESFLMTVIVIGPGQARTVAFAHALALAEFRTVIGARARLFNTVPVWFQEGLAVLVSEDPAYLGRGTGPRRCLVAPVGLPLSEREYELHALADRVLAARSVCGVLHWLAANGGRRELFTLLRSLRANNVGSEIFDPPVGVTVRR